MATEKTLQRLIHTRTFLCPRILLRCVFPSFREDAYYECTFCLSLVSMRHIALGRTETLLQRLQDEFTEITHEAMCSSHSGTLMW